MLAEAGDDTVIGDADQAADSYDGGEGDDLIDYSAVTSSVSVDLVEGEASGAEIGTDAIAGFEAVATGSGDDTVTGSDADEAIATGAGDDTVADGGGSDAVDTGAGDDIVKAALDTVADTYQGGEGRDTLDYSTTLSGVYIDLNEKTATGLEIGTDQVAGFEAIVGGAGNDTFVVVSETPVSLTGGEGEDVFEFQAATVDNAAGAVVHDILDFMVGDRLKVDKYEIFEHVMDTLEDRFEDIYGDKRRARGPADPHPSRADRQCPADLYRRRFRRGRRLRHDHQHRRRPRAARRRYRSHQQPGLEQLSVL